MSKKTKTTLRILGTKLDTTFTCMHPKSEELVSARVHRTIINPDLSDPSLIDWSCEPLGKLTDGKRRKIGHANLVTVIYRLEFRKIGSKPKSKKMGKKMIKEMNKTIDDEPFDTRVDLAPTIVEEAD